MTGRLGWPALAVAVLLGGTPVAAADRNEPNDTPARATAVQSNRPVTAEIGGADDVDWYRFDAPGPGSVFVNIGGDDLAVLAGVELLDGKGNRLAVPQIGVAKAGPVRVAVRGPGLAGKSYRVTFYYLPGVAAPGAIPSSPGATGSADPGDANEPNNDAAHATRVAVGAPVKASFRGLGDIDWYRVRAPKTGLLYTEVRAGGRRVEVDSKVRYAGGGEVSSSDSYMVMVRKGPPYRFIRVKAGEVLVGLEGFGHKGPYSVTFKLLPDAVAVRPPKDNPCRDPARAIPVVADTLVPVSLAGDAASVCFHLARAAPGLLFVDLGGEKARQLFDVTVLRTFEGLAMLLGNNAARLTAPGDVYIGIERSSLGSRTSAIDTVARIALLDNLPGDPRAFAKPETAPRITVGSAAPMAGAPVVLEPGGRDGWLRLHVSDAGYVFTEAMGVPKEFEATARVGRDRKSANRSRLRVVPGDYLIRLWTLGDYPWPFDVSVAFVPEMDSCEPNDDAKHACAITIGKPVPIAFPFADDEDWFSVEVERPGIVSVRLVGVPRPKVRGDEVVHGLEVYASAAESPAMGGERPQDRSEGLAFDFHAKKAGTYRFSLAGKWVDDNPLQSVMLTTRLYAEPCPDNNRAKAACRLRPGAETPVLFGKPKVKHWYQIDVARPGIIGAFVSGLPAPRYVLAAMMEGFKLSAEAMGPDGAAVPAQATYDSLFVRADKPGRYRFALSGTWHFSNPIRPVTLTTVISAKGEAAAGSAGMVIVGVGANAKNRSGLMELPFLAGIARGRYFEGADKASIGRAVGAAVEANDPLAGK